MTAAHPSERELHDFLFGRLSDDVQIEVESHFADCDECRDRALSAPAHDTLIELLTSAHTKADSQRSIAPTPTLDASPTPPAFAPTLAWQESSQKLVDSQIPPALANHSKYRVVRQLGIGGMGSVWLAEHTVMNRQVAVKVIRPDLLARPGATGRFLREVRAAAKLHHPNIVTAFDAEAVGDSCLLVMEYVPGQTLGERVESGPLPIAEACRAVRDAARGLAVAHRAGLVHRDVKPHNLIRDAEGTTKVLDFGLAGVAAGEAVAASGEGLTGAGMVVGTPAYIAPEQIVDPRSADARSDIYGLGCTLYHLLAGKPPVPEGSITDTLAFQQTGTPEAIAHLPPDLAAVLAKMIAKRPEDRYQSADEVVAALAPIETLVKPRGAWRLYIAVAMLAAAILIAGAIIYIQTDKGEFVIEVPDESVALMVNDKGIKIKDQSNGREYLLKAGARDVRTGDYEIVVSELPDGIEISGGKTFSVKRGGKAIATARLKTKDEKIEATVRPAPRPFVVHPNDAAVEQKFATLADAIAGARNGDTIEIRGNGPFVTAPVSIHDKALTIRAGDGFRPVFQLAPDDLKDNVPILWTDAALVLEGLEFRFPDEGNAFKGHATLIGSVNAPFQAANCRFYAMRVYPTTYCVQLEGNPVVELRNCEMLLLGHHFAVSWNYPQGGRLRMENCLHLGNVPLIVGCPSDNRQASIQLTHNTHAGYGPFFNVTMTGKPDFNVREKPIEVDAADNAVEGDCMVVLVQNSVWAKDKQYLSANEFRDLLPKLVHWRDRDNVYCPKQGLLSYFHPGVQATTPLPDWQTWKTLADWERYWGLERTNSRIENALKLTDGQGVGGLRQKLANGPDRLSPADFRIIDDKAPGANVDLVGPGAGYDRWKKTASYREWQTAVSPKPSATKPDDDLIQGKWQAISGERDGTPLTADELKQLTMTFAGETATVTQPGAKHTGTFTLNQTKYPKHISVTGDESEKFRGGFGIYELAGDTLKICMGDAKMGRPTEFKSVIGDKLFVNLVLKRETTSSFDSELIQGTWRAASVEHHGVKLDLAGEKYMNAAKITLTFTDDKVEMKRIALEGGNVPPGTVMRGMKGVVHLNPRTNPKQMTAHTPDFKDGFYGIYKIEGDTLTICHFAQDAAPEVVEFPTEFTGKRDNGTVLWVYKREAAAKSPEQLILEDVERRIDPAKTDGKNLPFALLERNGVAAIRFGKWLVVFEGVNCDARGKVLFGVGAFYIPNTGGKGNFVDPGLKRPAPALRQQSTGRGNVIGIEKYEFKMEGKGTRLVFSDHTYDVADQVQTIIVARDGTTRLEAPPAKK